MNPFFICFFEVFPSSFSIAALIGAAAIREQVATKLRWSFPQSSEDIAEENVDNDISCEEDDKKVEENNSVIDLKRRVASDDDQDGGKKMKSDALESLVNEPKLPFKYSETSFFERLKLAKCLFNDSQNITEERKNEDVKKEKDFMTIPRVSSPSLHSPPPMSRPQSVSSNLSPGVLRLFFLCLDRYLANTVGSVNATIKGSILEEEGDFVATFEVNIMPSYRS